jgi:hypothetical protein
VLEAVFILLEFRSPSRRIFIGSHSLPPSLVRRIGPSEPISKRKLAWEATEEEGKTTISAQHVHDFFNNLNTKQQWRELEKTKQLDPSKLGFLQTKE